jgi:hypothetical protein
MLDDRVDLLSKYLSEVTAMPVVNYPDQQAFPSDSIVIASSHYYDELPKGPQWLLMHGKPLHQIEDEAKLSALICPGDSSDKNINLTLAGRHLNRNISYPLKKCLAIIHSYNEEDIIGKTIEHLLENNIDVYVLDNWSADATFQVVADIRRQQPSRVHITRFPEVQTKYYEWETQLKETERLAKILSYDWYLHHDADEFIRSPFPELPLQQAISFIDHLGYNCISRNILDFRFIKRQTIFDNPLNDNVFFEFGNRPGHRYDQQIKAWKNIGEIDIASSAGHQVKFKTHLRRCYPILFRTDHYQFRNPQQMQRKLENLLTRIEKEYTQKNWHNHIYMFLDKYQGFDQENLIELDNATTQKYFFELISRIGIV